MKFWNYDGGCGDDMEADKEHLKILSIFHYIVAALTAAFSSIFIIHIVMGIAMLTGAMGGTGGSKGPPEMMG